MSFPLDLPDTGISEITITRSSIVGVSASPFTAQQQVQAHQGKIWRAEVTSVEIFDRVEAAPWIAFLARLNGPQNTLFLYDPVGQKRMGTATGSPVVNGASQTGQTLATSGWTSQDVALKAGDYIQLGSGAQTRLYMVMVDATPDANGEVTLQIWPQLRESPVDGSPITIEGCKGTFRLATNESSWTWQPPTRTRFTIEAVEAI